MRIRSPPGRSLRPIVVGLTWALRYTAAGRLLYATGSSLDAARLAGVNTPLVKLSAFACLGALTGVAAILNAMRFNQIPANSGLGLELKVIAAVVVGGTAITGGRGTLPGTLLGVALLGAIGPALTFLGVSAYWERAIQGAIILLAVAVDAIPRRSATICSAPRRDAGIRPLWPPRLSPKWPSLRFSRRISSRWPTSSRSPG